jgi:hypothetical protein
MNKTLLGVCYFHFETGTEGGYWAFQDAHYIYQDATLGTQFLPEGLHLLENGNELIIFDLENPSEIVWQGVIALHIFEPFSKEICGCWIHAEQIGAPRLLWAKWFFNEYPAQLTIKESPS